MTGFVKQESGTGRNANDTPRDSKQAREAAGDQFVHPAERRAMENRSSSSSSSASNDHESESEHERGQEHEHEHEQHVIRAGCVNYIGGTLVVRAPRKCI